MLYTIYLNSGFMVSFRVFSILGNFFYYYECLIWMLSFISAFTHTSESMKTCEEQFSVCTVYVYSMISKSLFLACDFHIIKNHAFFLLMH